MDKSEVQAVVEANIDRIRTAMNLHDWFIGINYEPTGHPGWAASCDRAGGDYQRASIIIDPNGHDSETEVLRSLVHELLHLVLAPFDVYRDAISSFAPDEADALEQRLWTHAVEQAATRLERGIARSLWEADAEGQ